MRAEVIALGLGAGCRPWIPVSESLAELGLALRSVTLAEPEEAAAEEAVRQALERSAFVVITGGAPCPGFAPGPGTDDLARKALAKVLKKRIILNADLLERLKGAYRERRMEPPAGFEKAALLPSGAKAAYDAEGLSAGFWLEHSGRLVLYMPCLQDDVKRHFPAELMRALARVRGPRRFTKARTLRCSGVDEARAAELTDGLPAGCYISLVSSPEGLDARVRASADTAEMAEVLLEDCYSAALSRLAGFVYGTGADRLEEVVARLLVEKRLTVATAESCTGGLVAKRLTDVSGSSVYMERGAVTYSNRSKEQMLDVPAKTLLEHGAVSKETAEAMAQGIRRKAGTDLGVSITGIAGPTGGTMSKPVGLVYIGLATPEGVTVKGYNFPGDREAVRFASSQRALDMLRRYLIT